MRTSQHPLADAVGLYRRAGRPEWSHGDRQFSGDVDYSGSRDLLERLCRPTEESGRFDELKIDGKLILLELGHQLPATGGRATFVFSTPMSGEARFFGDGRELADYRPLGRGQFPRSFYLVEEDYLHGENETPPETINNLMELVRLVVDLAKLAEHKYETEGTGAWTLVFRTKDDLGLLETRFDADFLDVEVPAVAWEILEGLRDASAGIHQREKRWMFTATMCEFLKNDVSFLEFVKNATKWVSAYDDDLRTYLSGFSFEEVKRTIAEEHTRFAKKISTILGDITVKVLSLPLSVAVAMILKAQAEGVPWWFPALLLVVVAFMITFLVRHYQRVALQVQQNVGLVFDRVEVEGAVAYPTDLNKSLKDAVQSLQKETTKLRTTLRIYMIATWAVPIIGLAVMLCA